MLNAVKLTIDKEEYVANTQDINLTVSNLSSLGVKNLYLTSDERDRYPVKSVNGNTVTIDSTIIENNTSKTFMLCGEQELPKFEFLDMPTIWTLSEFFSFHIKRGDWVNNVPSTLKYLDIELFTADSDVSITRWDTDLMDYISTNSTSLLVDYISLRHKDIGSEEELSVVFRVYGESNGKRTYYAESNAITVQLNNKESTATTHLPVYANMDAMIFEAGKEYMIPYNSPVENYLNLYGYIGIKPLNSTLTGYNMSKIWSFEVVDRVYAKFTMPNLSGVIADRAECYIQLYLSETPITSNNAGNHKACSSGYRCIYVSNINNKHSLV